MTTPAPRREPDELQPYSPDLRIPRTVSGIAGLGTAVLTAMRLGVESAVPLVGGMVTAMAAVATLLLLWFAVGGDRPATRGALRTGCLTGTVLGSLGLAGGFIGPLVLSPDSPQGPLLGLFVTGPLGALVGALLGSLVGLVRELR